MIQNKKNKNRKQKNNCKKRNEKQTKARKVKKNNNIQLKRMTENSKETKNE